MGPMGRVAGPGGISVVRGGEGREGLNRSGQEGASRSADLGGPTSLAERGSVGNEWMKGKGVLFCAYRPFGAVSGAHLGRNVKAIGPLPRTGPGNSTRVRAHPLCPAHPAPQRTQSPRAGAGSSPSSEAVGPGPCTAEPRIYGENCVLRREQKWLLRACSLKAPFVLNSGAGVTTVLPGKHGN